MNTLSITVAVLGTGSAADLLVERIRARADLRFVGSVAATDDTPAGTDCVVVLPSHRELEDGSAARNVSELLRAGFDVVSTVPPEAFGETELLDACRAGGSTFHGTGGFQSRLITRFNRAFASISRNIEDVVLVEECALEDDVDLDDARAVEALAAESAVLYEAGLRTLSDAVFGETPSLDPVTSSAVHLPREDGARRLGSSSDDRRATLVVRRSLGTRVSYDSAWSRSASGDETLRYQLHTKTADAIGHVDLTFRAEGGTSPRDHLTCAGLLDAIAPVHASAAGVLRHDLAIDFVRPDPRFAR